MNHSKRLLEYIGAPLDTFSPAFFETGPVKDWLESISFGVYYQNFKADGYDDLETIGTMTVEDFKDIGITKGGHIKKLMRSLTTLQATGLGQNSNSDAVIKKFEMIQTLHSKIEGAWQITTVEHLLSTVLPSSNGERQIALSTPVGDSQLLPISFSVWHGASVEVVYFLYTLYRPSLIWTSPRSKWTLLHYAAHFKRDHLLPLLIALDPKQGWLKKNNKGATALDLANRSMHQVSVKHLANTPRAIQQFQDTYPTIASEITENRAAAAKELAEKNKSLELARKRQSEEMKLAKKQAYEEELRRIEAEKLKREKEEEERRAAEQKRALDQAKQDAIEQAKRDAAEKAAEAERERLRLEMKAKYEQELKEQQQREIEAEAKAKAERIRKEAEHAKQDLIEAENAKRAVKLWLSGLNLSMYYDTMINEGYDDLNTVRSITEESLAAMGIEKVGHVAKLTNAIRALSNRYSAMSTASSGSGSIASANDVGKIVLNYNFQIRGRNLSKRKGTKVVLANTNDAQNTPLVAKLTKSSTLEREAQVLRLLKAKHGDSANEYVVKLYDYIENYDHDGTSALVLERGVDHRGTLADRFASHHDKQPFIQKISVAYEILQIGQFIHQAGLVWGDVKPGNFVCFNVNNAFRYKAIDFDSCFYSTVNADNGAAPSLGSEIPFSSEIPSLEMLVTPGFIAPERAEMLALQKEETSDTGKVFPAIGSKQDVFIFGLILYRLFTGEEYFPSEQVENGEYEKILASQNFKPVFPKSLRGDVRKILGEMMRRDPIDRASFDQILNHSVWNSESSVRMSTIVNRLDSVEQKILESIEDGFGRVEDQLEGLGQKMDSVFQLIVNLQNSKYPYFCFCLPEVRENGGGMFEWVDAIKKGTLERIGWSRYFRFYVLDEGPMLLPGLCKELDEPLPDKKGIGVELPGALLKKIAPYMYFMSKMIAMAVKVGKYIPMARPLTDAINFDLLSDSFKLIVGVTGQMKKVEGYIKKFETNMKTIAKQDKMTKAARGEDSTMAVQALEVMEQVFGKDGFGEKGWKKFVTSGKIKKVYRKSDGSIHWVAAAHVSSLEKHGYAVDQRLGLMGDGGGNGGKPTASKQQKLSKEEAIAYHGFHVNKSSWKPNGSSNVCSNCDVKFTFVKRRHHCRKCGELVCGKCSTQNVYVADIGGRKLRVCDACFGMKSWVEWKNLSVGGK